MMDLLHWIDGFLSRFRGGWIPVTEPATGKALLGAAGTSSDIECVQAPVTPAGPKPQRPNACRFWSVLQR